MTILPLTLARVSNLQQSTIASETINGTQNDLLAVEQELATGKVVNQPSDNPSAASIIQQLQQTLNDRQQYSTNLTATQDKLNEVDSTLGGLTSLLNQVQSISSQDASSTVSPSERTSDAGVIDGIFNQVLSSANTSYGGSYLFGGNKGQTQPYTQTSLGIEFTGSTTTLQNTLDAYTQLGIQVDATSVFGGQSASISTGTNLAPKAEATNRISDLAGATNVGVSLGSINISNGATSTVVDLSKANTLGDVVNAINSAGITGVTAGLSNSGINLTATGTADIQVNEVGGGTTASDLGILRTTFAGVDAPLTGAAVNPKVTNFTTLADLRGGLGLDTTGFNISSGTTTKTVSLNGLTTVQDLLAKVNTSGVGVKASINSDGTGIDLFNVTQGSPLRVSENGGNTATQLGFRTFNASTPLASLNDGAGVSTPAGNQFKITTADGTVSNIALTNATTVQDVLTQINTATGGKVTASFSTHGNGIVLTDNTSGSGTLTVAAINASTTASDLGLATAAVGNTITGTDVNPVEAPGILGDLQKLSAALKNNNTSAIADAGVAVAKDAQQITDAQASVGARVKEISDRSDALTAENTSTQTLLSSFQDTDFATAVTQYQTLQTSLQASLEVTAKSLNLSLLNYVNF